MMWWRKRRIQLPPTLDEQRKIKEAQQARAAAEESLEQTKRQAAEVSKVSATLRKLRENNNFGALIQRSMMRR